MGICDSQNSKNNNIQIKEEFNKDINENNNIINENKNNTSSDNNIKEIDIIKKDNKYPEKNFKKDNIGINNSHIISSDYLEQDVVEQLKKVGFFDENIEEQLRKSGFIEPVSKEQLKLKEQNITEELKKSGVFQLDDNTTSLNNTIISSKVLPVQVLETVANKPIIDENIKTLPVIYINE